MTPLNCSLHWDTNLGALHPLRNALQSSRPGAHPGLLKVEDLQDMMRYGVMSTPGVVIDGTVVHSGGIPSQDKIAGWLT